MNMKNEEIVRALRCGLTHRHGFECEQCPYLIEVPAPEGLRETIGSDVLHRCDTDRLGMDGAALIERLTARCARYAEEIAVLQERTRWIPVTERLPDQCVDVLVRYRDKHILMGTARCDDWLDEDLEDGVITHWMRMPKGPEDE